MKLFFALFATSLLPALSVFSAEIEVPPIILPEIPKVRLEIDGASPSEDKPVRPPEVKVKSVKEVEAEESGIDSLTPTRIKSTKFLYFRKKSGQGELSISSTVNCLVKLIDLSSGRLAGFVAMPANRRVVFPLPESTYGIVFAESPGTFPDGRFGAKAFWKILEIDMTTPGTRERVELTTGLEAKGVERSDLKTYNRFNPPGSAAVSLD